MQSLERASLGAFLGEATRAFDGAVRAVGLEQDVLEVAGQTIELRFAGNALRDRILPSLRHLRAAGRSPTLSVVAFDSRSTGVPMPRPPWSARDVVERGEVRGFNTERFRTVWNAGSSILSLYDREARRAIVWTPDAAEVPYYETASPLRTLLSWWLDAAGLQVVHAAGVGEGGRGVLLTGRGGSGKTTTALLCAEAGFGYAGDNNLVLEPTVPPIGHALFASATVRPDPLERLPRLRARLRNEARLATEKGLLFLDDRPDARLLRSFEVAGVLLPRVVEATTTRLERATPAACLAALAPSSILSLPGASGASFARLADFARRVPAWHLLLAPDLDAIPALVRGVLEGRAP